MTTPFKKLGIALTMLTMGFGTVVTAEARASNTSGSALSGFALVAVMAAGSMVIQGGGEFVVKAVRPIVGGVALILEDSGTGATELHKLSGDGIGALGKLGFLERAGARIGASNIRFDDHPRQSAISGQFGVVSVNSVVSRLARNGMLGKRRESRSKFRRDQRSAEPGSPDR